MEDTSKSLKKRYQVSRAANRHFGRGGRAGEKKNSDKQDEDDDENEDEEDEDCDVEAWETLSKSINDVQSVLDHNRVLIKQVNENHQSKLPDNLVKNVALIQEINGNISKVMGLYSDLSVNFPSIVQQRRALSKSIGDTSNSSSNS